MGRECGICPWVIAGDDELAAETNDLEEVLRYDARHAGFMVKVEAWQSEQKAKRMAGR